MAAWILSLLVQVMGGCLTAAKPLHNPTITMKKTSLNISVLYFTCDDFVLHDCTKRRYLLMSSSLSLFKIKQNSYQDSTKCQSKFTRGLLFSRTKSWCPSSIFAPCLVTLIRDLRDAMRLQISKACMQCLTDL